MARTGMAYLINELRGLAEAGVKDFTIGTSTYFSDDQLEDFLDLRRHYYNQLDLTAEPTYGVGTITWTKHYTGISHWENAGTVQGAGGTAVAGTAYTFTALTGEVDFVNDTEGAGYVFTGYAFDVYGAAADVWRRKMSYYASAYDVSGDGQSLTRSQLMKHAKEMASYYRDLSMSYGGATGRSGVITIEREDT